MAIKEVRGTKDNLSRGFKDIGVGFLLNAFTKDAAVVKNENAIKQSIKNLVLTQKGEKLFQPEIGSGVYELLFEPICYRSGARLSAFDDEFRLWH